MPGDEGDERGRTLLAKLCALDRVIICGQAASHCVNFSARDLADAWKRTTAGATDEDARRRMAHLVVLRDATSPVPGFEVRMPWSCLYLSITCAAVFSDSLMCGG